MPDDDLLRYLIGPEPYSGWWPWASAALILCVIGWYAWLFLATSASRRIRDVRLVRVVRDELIKLRAVRDIRGIARRHRAGELTAPAAGAALSREVCRFLHAATGLRVQYMHVGAVAAGPAGAAAPLLSELVDVQFNPRSTVDVDDACATAEGLVMRWS